jgi:hypothetical protein
MRTTLVGFIIFFALGLSAQTSVANIVNGDKKMVFVGVDFRNAKLIGTSGFTDPAKIQNIYLQEWNSIFLTEYEKYSFHESFKLPLEKYKVNISEMILLNESFVVAENITNEMDYVLEEEKLSGMVSDYKTKETDGIGVAYIVESFDKLTESANIYVVFFDLGSKSIFFSQKVTTKPGGFGVKNYWARSFINIRDDNFSSWYKDWKKAFKRK